jgi:hypothetical protein
MVDPVVEAKPIVLHAGGDPLDAEDAVERYSGTDGFTDFTEAAHILLTTEFFDIWKGINPHPSGRTTWPSAWAARTSNNYTEPSTPVAPTYMKVAGRPNELVGSRRMLESPVSQAERTTRRGRPTEVALVFPAAVRW